MLEFNLVCHIVYTVIVVFFADALVADDAATLASKLGLVLDAAAIFGGPRLKRGAVVIDSGKVVSLAVEPSPGEGESPAFCSQEYQLTFSHRLARRRSHQGSLSVKSEDDRLEPDPMLK